MTCCLLLGILVSLIGGACPQTTILRDVTPNFILVFQSNEYESGVCLEDPRCSVTTGTVENGEGCSEAEILLGCEGAPSILFDGVIGIERSQDADLLQYYTWRQQYTSKPFVAMFFDPPLVEIPNITLYFYHEGGDIQAPSAISVCFSSSLEDPCNRIEPPTRPRVERGMIVWPVILTDATSIEYLRIDMQHIHPELEQDYIFLSEIRVAGRLQVQTVTPTPSSTATSLQYLIPTSSAIVDETPANTSPTNTLSHSPIVVNGTGRTTTRDNDDDSVSVAIISGAVIGTSLLTTVIMVMMIMMMIVCSRRRKESRRSHNIDDNDVTVKLSSHTPNTQQHTSNTSGAKVDPTPRLERVNVLYIPTEVKSLDLLLQHHDVIGSDVIITPNPSYSVGPNSLDTGKDCEYQYDYVQTDDGLVEHDKVVGSTTSGGMYDEITDDADNVNIDPNPSYSLAQDVKLEDNPSYNKLYNCS